jgi:uncharacterized protein
MTTSFQAQFHSRWNHLNDPHVRTLAWLLDAPDLLDAAATEWQGRVATLGPPDDAIADWLVQLDRSPAVLHAFLDTGPYTRLGRYAEKLMAFYLRHCGRLVAHGVQVRAAKGDTVGEFDFLVDEGGALVHWEFATKLYLLEASGNGRHVDYFVGPNLADTLGLKISKIMDRQLALSKHPAAQSCLPRPVSAARALVKGWLFYHGRTPVLLQPPEISQVHCRGFWCAFDELHDIHGERFLVLPRLGWLAPAKARMADTLGRAQLTELLDNEFGNGAMPVLVAVMKENGRELLEADRGFIVPSDWRSRAGMRVRGGSKEGS